MLDRLAAAGAGGESLANEVDQLRSQVRFSLFFSMPVLFLFRFRSLFLSLSFSFSLREGFGFSQCAHAEMEHLGLIWGGGGERRNGALRRKGVLLSRLLSVTSVFSFFLPIDSTSRAPPPPPEKQNQKKPHTQKKKKKTKTKHNKNKPNPQKNKK